MSIVKFSTGMLIVCVLSSAPTIAADKQNPIYKRQVKLMSNVNAAQKSNQITVKQAKKLRKDLSKIAVRKQQVISKNKVTAGSANMAGVEESLSKTSAKINEIKQENANGGD